MKKLLYIDCCIRREKSRTRVLAERFLKAVEARGEYEITRLTLPDENLSYFSDGFFEQRERMLAAHTLDEPRFRYAHQFAEADRIVIAAPFWDLSFPALLKVYIENVSVEGISFGCDASGCFGICKAKEMLYLTTRGGDYSEGSETAFLEQATPYLESMCAFFGIERFRSIAADGMDLGIEPVETILERACAEAETVAKEF